MTFKNLFAILVLLSIVSCAPKSYYQVFRVEADKGMSGNNQELIYEDDHCKITYDLWGASGNIGFLFYNKSDQMIYIQKDETFYIQNGTANNYYKNRTITNSSSRGVSAHQGNNATVSVAEINTRGLPQVNSLHVSSKKEVINSTGYAVSIAEEIVVAIPPQTAKYISEYYINDFIYRDCDLQRYPRRDSASASFVATNTPFSFGNRIVYQVGKEGTTKTIINNFYVSSITNYPSSSVVKTTYREICGKQTNELIQVFKVSGPEKFYLKYYR